MRTVFALVVLLVITAFLRDISHATVIQSAAGQTVNAAITIPTTYSDGTALPLSDLAMVIISWRRPSYNPNIPLENPVAGSEVVSAPIPGYSFSKQFYVNCGAWTFEAFGVTTPTAHCPSCSGPQNKLMTYNTGVPCKPGAVAVTVQ